VLLADTFTIVGISVGVFLFICLLQAPFIYDRWGASIRRVIERSRRKGRKQPWSSR